MDKAITLAEKIRNAKKEAGAVKKDATNPFLKNKYATLNAVMEALDPACEKVGLAYTQIPDTDGLTTTIVDVATGEKISGKVMFLAASDMQKLGSAITYARRYALLTMFNLETEDDDANGAAGKTNAAKGKPSASAVLPDDIIEKLYEANSRDELTKICRAIGEKEPKYKPALNAFYKANATKIGAEAK